jgi:recombinational DNA repair ATPase RecF
MSRALVEQRLTELSERLRETRRELAIADEQLASLADDADEARLRSLVSETPLAEQEHRAASRHAEAMARHRDSVRASIEQMERAQDDLLDRLIASGD